MRVGFTGLARKKSKKTEKFDEFKKTEPLTSVLEKNI